MPLRTCTRCGAAKPTGDFTRKAHCCLACTRAQSRARIKASRRWIDEFARRWRRANGTIVDSANAFVEQRGPKTHGAPDAYYRLRHQAIMAYGGYRCACCGEGEPMFLTLDHITNDGARDRRESGTNQNILRSLRTRGYPPGFQVLCSNCNHGRHRNGGTCPHKTRRDSE